MAWRSEGEPLPTTSLSQRHTPDDVTATTTRLARPPRPPEAVPWAELHCHSSFSFLDGAATPAELVAEAARLGLEALAITDHNGMYGAPQFVQAAAKLTERTGITLGTVF